MSTFKFSDYPGAGQVQMDKGFHQAVEVNGIIYISGQGKNVSSKKPATRNLAKVRNEAAGMRR